MLVIGCNYLDTYQLYFQHGVNINISKPILLLLAIDIEKYEIATIKSLQLLYHPKILTVIMATGDLFAIIIADGETDGSIMNNHIIRYLCNWTYSDINLEYIETINYFSLKIPSFLAVTFDGTYDFNMNLILYVYDLNYGIRVLNAIGKDSMKIIHSLKLSSEVTSIGVCGSNLFLAHDDTSVSVYIITNAGSLRYSMIYYPFNNSTFQYKGARGIIKCNKYYSTNFIAIPMTNPLYSVLRIIDLDNEFSSAILRDIIIQDITDNTTIFPSFHFINSSAIVVVNINTGTLTSYLMQKFKLFIPSMSLTQYNELLSF